MLRLPRELKSGTPQAQWLNQLLRAVRSMEAKQAPGVTVEVGPRGTEIRARKVRPGSGTSGVTFEGEYDSTRSYDAFSIVVVSGGGPSSGSYISLVPVPAGQSPSYPDVGIYWRILGRTSEVAFFF